MGSYFEWDANKYGLDVREMDAEHQKLIALMNSLHMARIEYPELRVHAGVHKNLLARLAGYETGFRATGILNDDFFMFLKTWLKAHICGIDMKYSEHAHKTHAA